MKQNKITFEPFLKFNIIFYNEIEALIILSEKLNVEKEILSDEKSILHEAFLVKLAAEWEFYCHCILAYCISLNTQNLSRELHLNLPQKIGFNNAYAILNGVNFISIKGVDDLISKSKKYICTENNPFIKVDRKTLKNLDTILTFRNYIAHQSLTSKERLNKFYSSKNLKFMKPGDYLLMNYDKDNYSNCRALFAALATLSTEIWKILDLTSYNFVYGEYETLEASLSEQPDSSDKFETLKEEFFKAIRKMESVFALLENHVK